MATKKVSQAGEASSKVTKPTQRVSPTGSRGASGVYGPDELARKIAKHGLEFASRFASGIRYLGGIYSQKVDTKSLVDESWEESFREVIGDILEKSGLDYENVVDFTIKQYKRFLKDFPSERERIKKHVTEMAGKIKEKKDKKYHA